MAAHQRGKRRHVSRVYTCGSSLPKTKEMSWGGNHISPFSNRVAKVTQKCCSSQMANELLSVSFLADVKNTGAKWTLIYGNPKKHWEK